MLPLQHPPQFKPSLGLLPRLPPPAPRDTLPLLALPSLSPSSRAHPAAPSSSTSFSSSSSSSLHTASTSSATSKSTLKRKESATRAAAACLFCKNSKIKCSGSIDGGSCVGCWRRERRCEFSPPESRDLKGLRRVVEACMGCRKSKVRCDGAMDGGACKNCSSRTPKKVCVFSTQPTRDRAADSRRKRAKLAEQTAAIAGPPPLPEPTSSTTQNQPIPDYASIFILPNLLPPPPVPSMAPIGSSPFSNLVVRPRNCYFVGSVWFFFTRSSSKSSSTPLTDLPSGEIGDGDGMMMLASYSESPYGAYDEIVWSPGSFDVSDITLSKEALRVARPTHAFSSSLDAVKENRWGASAELGRFNFTPFDGSTLVSVFSTPSNPTSTSTTPKLIFEALTTPCSLPVLLSPISSLLRTQGSRIWRGFGAQVISGTIQACWVERRSISGSSGKDADGGEEEVEGKELWCLGCAVEDGTLVWGDSRMR